MPSDTMYSVALLPTTGGRPLRAVKMSSEGRAEWTPSEARRNFLLARRLVGGDTQRRDHTSDWLSPGVGKRGCPTGFSGCPSFPEPPCLRICSEVCRHHLSKTQKFRIESINLNSKVQLQYLKIISKMLIFRKS